LFRKRLPTIDFNFTNRNPATNTINKLLDLDYFYLKNSHYGSDVSLIGVINNNKICNCCNRTCQIVGCINLNSFSLYIIANESMNGLCKPNKLQKCYRVYKNIRTFKFKLLKKNNYCIYW
jgi:hypothetical protein